MASPWFKKQCYEKKYDFKDHRTQSIEDATSELLSAINFENFDKQEQAE